MARFLKQSVHSQFADPMLLIVATACIFLMPGEYRRKSVHSHRQQNVLSLHEDGDESPVHEMAERVEQAHVATEVVESLYEAISHSLEVGHVVSPELSGLAVGAGFSAIKILIKKAIKHRVFMLSHEGFLHQVFVLSYHKYILGLQTLVVTEHRTEVQIEICIDTPMHILHTYRRVHMHTPGQSSIRACEDTACKVYKKGCCIRIQCFQICFRDKDSRNFGTFHFSV